MKKLFIEKKINFYKNRVYLIKFILFKKYFFYEIYLNIFLFVLL
jgi:hypothetical protein